MAPRLTLEVASEVAPKVAPDTDVVSDVALEVAPELAPKADVAPGVASETKGTPSDATGEVPEMAELNVSGSTGSKTEGGDAASDVLTEVERKAATSTPSSDFFRCFSGRKDGDSGFRLLFPCKIFRLRLLLLLLLLPLQLLLLQLLLGSGSLRLEGVSGERNDAEQLATADVDRSADVE